MRPAIATAITASTALVIVLLRRHSTFATVHGASMSPTFTDGERVFALGRVNYRVGDVVVFRPPQLRSSAHEPPWRIKRLAAIAGQATPSWLRECRTGSGPVSARVPVGYVVVVGDNRISEDSRQLGFIPVAAIAGRVVPHRPATPQTRQPSIADGVRSRR
jgi:signal peptidase I